MSAHVLLHLLKELRIISKNLTLYLFFALSLINSIILEHEY